MKRGAWLFVLVLLLLLPLVAPFDRQISDWLRADAHQQLANEILGRVFAVSLFLNILFILGGYANWKRLVAGFILPIVLSAVLTHTAKQLVGRARPDAGEGPAAFHETAWFVEHQTSQSFPSGHATTAAALAVLLGMYFPRFRYAFYLGAG